MKLAKKKYIDTIAHERSDPKDRMYLCKEESQENSIDKDTSFLFSKG